MKHARPDYDRIQDPAGIIPEDEPVFLFRAQDRLSATVVAFYVHLLREAKADPALVAMAEGWVERMKSWPVQKLPDYNKE